MDLYFIIIMIIERLLHGDKMQMIIHCCNERDQCQMEIFILSHVQYYI